jgi:hypothetical protein
MIVFPGILSDGSIASSTTAAAIRTSLGIDTDDTVTFGGVIGTRGAIGVNATIAGTSLLYPATNYGMTLVVQETKTDLSASKVGTWVQLEADPVANSNTGLYAFMSSNYVKTANDKNIGRIYGSWTEAIHQGTGTLTTAYGGFSVGQANAASPLTNNYGFRSEAYGGTSNYAMSLRAIRNASYGVIGAGSTYGLESVVANTEAISSGTDTNYGVASFVTRTGATGGTVASYGFYSQMTVDNAGAGSHFSYDYYAAARSGSSDADYFLWFGSPGVYRIKADGVMAYYNPAFSPAYTPNAVNYERVVQQWSGNVLQYGLEAGGTGVLRGLQLLGATLAMTTTAVTFTAPASSDVQLVLNTTTANRYATIAFKQAGTQKFTLSLEGPDQAFGIYHGATDKYPIWIDPSDNIGLCQVTFGTSAARVFAQASGTAPSTSPPDCYQLYSADISAGVAAPHVRTENGKVVRIYQVLGWSLPTGTLSRAAFDQSTVTLPELAQRVAAILTDLYSGHQLIGA